MKESLPKVTEAKEVEVQDLAKLCSDNYAKYVGGRLWCKTPAWTAVLERLRAMCESEDVDPALYVESQFSTMALWCKKNGGRFYPNVMMGANAVSRYEAHIERNKRHTTNINARPGADLTQDTLDAETTYGELVLRNILWGLGEKSGRIAKMVKARHPSWKPNNPDYAAIRRRALMVVIDKVIPGCSSNIFLKSDFTWKSVAGFIRQSGYVEQSTQSTIDPELKGLISNLRRDA